MTDHQTFTLMEHIIKNRKGEITLKAFSYTSNSGELRIGFLDSGGNEFLRIFKTSGAFVERSM